MPKATFYGSDCNVTSSYSCRYNSNTQKYFATTPTTGSSSISVDYSSIPAGSTINSARIYRKLVNGMWGGTTWIDGSYFSDGVSVSVNAGGWSTYEITYKCNATVHAHEQKHSSTVKISEVRVEVDYILPYTRCTPPTNVSVSNNNVAPNASVSLSWLGANAGTNNAIKSYTVYRSTSASTGYTAIKSGITSTSYTVAAPSSNGATYYYKVKAIGSVAGYDSDLSSAYASLKCVYSNPSVSNVRINGSAGSVYVKAGSNVTLSWAGTDGRNNAIKSYTITRNGVAYKSGVTGTSLSVPSHSSSGSSYYYSVQPIGTYSNGSAINSPTVYSYAACTAPTSLSLSANNVSPSRSVTLSWSGAGNGGSYNTITGYLVYRSTAYNGTYSHIATVNSTSTSGSVAVTAPSSNGSSYYYKIITRGNRLNSGYSGYTALKCVFTAPLVTGLTLSSQYAPVNGSVTLSWTGKNGTNNAIKSYTIYRGGTEIASGITSTSYTVTANATAGQSYQYAVQAIGTYSNSSVVNAPVLYTYGNLSAPTSVSVSPNVADAGTTATLSWSGASAGAYNAITKYYIYRSTAYNGTYSHIATVNSTSTSGSTTVTAHNTMGSAYYYKVITGGAYTNSGYSGYASLTSRVYTSVEAPTSVSVSPSIVDAGTTATLSWSGAKAGTNNPITGYEIYRSTSPSGTYDLIKTVSTAAVSSSLSVTAHSTMGNTYYYKVRTLGTKSGFTPSGYSDYASLKSRTYTAVTAPTTVKLSANIANPSQSAMLSWSGAKAGTNVDISGYDIYMSTGDTYTLLSQQAANISSLSVSANATSGVVQSYKIKTRADKAGYDSGFSAVVQLKTNTAPSMPPSIILSPMLYETGNLNISFGKSLDVDDNLSHYQIQRRIQTSDSGWGSWSNLVTDLSTLSYNDTPNVERGYGVQYRVKAHDKLGLYSDYRTSEIAYRNKVPLEPTLVYPTDNKKTYRNKPIIKINAGAEPDGNPQKLQVAIDTGGFVDVSDISPSGGAVHVALPNLLSVGEHTIKIRLRDSLGAVSPEISVTIKVLSTNYARNIARGAIIANDSISHQAEIKQLYEQINDIRMYYGLNAISIPELVGRHENVDSGNIGMFAAWGEQMAGLQKAINDTKIQSGMQNIIWIECSKGMYPKADIVTQIRNEIRKA